MLHYFNLILLKKLLDISESLRDIENLTTLCENLIGMFNPQLVRDETHFHLSDAINKQNS